MRSDATEQSPAAPVTIASRTSTRPASRGFFQRWMSARSPGSASPGARAVTKPQTLRYPFEKLTLSPRWRGALRLSGILGTDDIPLSSSMPDEYNGADRPPVCGEPPSSVRRELPRQRGRPRPVLPPRRGPSRLRPTSWCASATSCPASSAGSAITRASRRASATTTTSRSPSGLCTASPSSATPKCARSASSRCPGPANSASRSSGRDRAGSAAAFDLMRLGYSVTVYEKDHHPGGALYSGVPAYRLPREVLKQEVDDLVTMGMELKLNVRGGRGRADRPPHRRVRRRAHLGGSAGEPHHPDPRRGR